MKFLFDLFPVILFFASYKLGNMFPQAAHDLASRYLGGLTSGGVIVPDQASIMVATALAIVATFLQIGYLLVRGRKVDGMLWLSLGVIVVMGGATIYFHDATFLKWKPTIYYWACALALLIAQVGFHKNLMRKAMEEQIKLPDAIWDRVGYAWMAFCAAMGVLNLVMAFVVFKDDMDAWVSFKAIGTPGISFIFIVGQTLLLAKHIPEDA